MKKILTAIFVSLLVMTTQTALADGLFSKAKTPDYYESNTREHFRHGRWKEGKQLLDEGWKNYGTMSVMNELMGRYYYHYKKYDKARFYLVRALRDDNTNTAARELLVNVEEETHNYSSAICYINELLESNPYSRGWWRRKINLYRKQGNNIEANRLLVRLQQIYPNDEVVRKDVAYLNEQTLIKQKHDGDVNGMLETLSNIVKAYPESEEYHLQYANQLLQLGRSGEAAEAAGKGARLTKSTALMKKRASILAEQGNYQEAINYLQECQKTYGAASLSSTIDEIERSAAQAAMLNDPYIATAKVYAKHHDSELLNFLLNTAIARGYYDDALMYIQEAKGKGSGTADLMYKEYIVQRRLGNKSAAYGILEKLYEQNPKNEEVRDNLSIMRYESAVEAMNMQQYSEAINDLIFVCDNAVDDDLRKSAAQRLFNCYFETKQYEAARQQLNLMKKDFDYEDYDMQSAALYYADGRTQDALNVLQSAYDREKSVEKQRTLSYQYGEYAIPYVKSMIERGQIALADKAVKKALLVCPANVDLLHMALTTSDLLGNRTDYEEMVAVGRQRYPDDPFFIAKEASIVDAQGNYEQALAMIRPQLDIYQGDSTLTRAYAEYSINLANKQAKSKAYSTAIATLDSALVFNHNDRELLYNKGLLFEKMKQYDSAYVYQKYYRPTLMDFQEHKKHLEELLGRGYPNEVSIMYQQARPGDEDILSANAFASYTRHNKHDDYTYKVGYAGRDGNGDDSLTNEDQESGGTGIQLGFDWTHRMKAERWKRWSYTVGGAWASKYFPRLYAHATVSYENDNNWIFDVHGSYRKIKVYKQAYAWIVNTEKVESSDPDYILAKDGWTAHRLSLWQLGVGAQKTWDNIIGMATADGFVMNRHFYYNGVLKGQFFPIEGSRTHVYASVGVGNAPQTELLDTSMPSGFSKLNTFVGGGLMYFFNRHLAGSLSGTWYTMYRSQKIQSGVWGSESSTLSTTSSTNYKNMFYIQGEVVILF